LWFSRSGWWCWCVVATITQHTISSSSRIGSSGVSSALAPLLDHTLFRFFAQQLTTGAAAGDSLLSFKYLHVLRDNKHYNVFVNGIIASINPMTLSFPFTLVFKHALLVSVFIVLDIFQLLLDKFH
jgi:hypothetical protein